MNLLLVLTVVEDGGHTHQGARGLVLLQSSKTCSCFMHGRAKLALMLSLAMSIHEAMDHGVFLVKD